MRSVGSWVIWSGAGEFERSGIWLSGFSEVEVEALEVWSIGHWVGRVLDELVVDEEWAIGH